LLWVSVEVCVFPGLIKASVSELTTIRVARGAYPWFNGSRRIHPRPAWEVMDSTAPTGRVARTASEPCRLAYFVSRFPTTTETFVVRELNAVAAQPGIEADL